MQDESSIRAAEAEFFGALLAGNTETLDRLLAADFTLVALNGMLITKAELTGAMAAGVLVFERIDPVSAVVRFHGGTAVVTGQTKMSAQFAGTSSTTDSRYTHIYVEQDGRPQFIAAQGTPIAAS